MTRKKPYTKSGLKRVPCRQCGKPSEHQWNLRPCALGFYAWYGLCGEHDLALNRIVVDFLRVPDGAEIMAAYEKRLERAEAALVPRRPSRDGE